MSAKELWVEPISSADARALVKLVHYSHRCCMNSQLHLGVFWRGRLEGAMQFGPPMDRRKLLGLVRGTRWNGFLELNRMAFGERLPRNSESRAIGVAMRMIRKTYPHIEWIVSFADATQCGDGTIYRASGFVLTAVRKNTTILQMPDGSVVADLTLNTASPERAAMRKIMARKTLDNPNHVGFQSGWWKKNGAVPLPGYQLRYIYFLNPEARARLTVPEIPFAAIGDAAMYRGQRRAKHAMAGDQPAQRRGSADQPAPSADAQP